MKNRMKIVVVIAILLLVGYVVSEHFNKKESNREEVAIEVIEEVKELSKPNVEIKKVVKKEKNTKKTKKSPSKSTKKKVSKKKVAKKTTKKVSYNKSELHSYAHDLVISYGWTEYDFECLVKLWNRESGWKPNAVNKRSGACGIPQALPCKKMSKEGSDYRTNGKTQIRWGLKYIKNRYGSPSKAWAHSQRTGWY